MHVFHKGTVSRFEHIRKKKTQFLIFFFNLSGILIINKIMLILDFFSLSYQILVSPMPLNHRIESLNCLGWKEPQRSSSFNLPAWTGTASARPVC